MTWGIFADRINNGGIKEQPMDTRKILFALVICCALLLTAVAIATLTDVITVSKSGSGHDLYEVHINSTPKSTEKLPVDSALYPTDEPQPTSTNEPSPDPTDKGVDIDPDKPIVALSFDDGPSDVSTNRILDLIERYNVSATFFVVGGMARTHPEAMTRAAELGCEIGNHTDTHKLKFEGASASEIEKELSAVDKAVKNATGKETYLVRPPWGSYDAGTLKNTDRPLILWSVDTEDWKSRDKDAVVEVVKKGVYDGSIILMHDIYGSTADACEVIIPWLIEQGYQVVNVTQLFEARGIKLEPGNVYRDARPAVKPTEKVKN